MINSATPAKADWPTPKTVLSTCKNGNLLSGAASQIGCTNSLLRSDDADIRIVGLGLENVAAIATADAVLVANMNSSERVKHVFAELKLMNSRQMHGLRNSQRSWGHEEALTAGPRFHVMRLTVKPGGQLSLKTDEQHSEFWIVVEGAATMVVDETTKTFAEGERANIEPGVEHRLENRGSVPLTLIKVQFGPWPGDSDVSGYDELDTRVAETTA